MKLVVQRVKMAKVTVDNRVVGEIQKGLFVLVGVRKNDTKEMASLLAQKLVKLRVMADDQDKMNLSVKDIKAPLLVVSQFTLYADTSSGNRPSFINAEDPIKAREIYEHFLNCLRTEDLDIQTGSFGEYMQIDCQLDGPVTIVIEG